MDDIKKDWYLLYCKGKEELRALINLENQGYESFYPTIKIERKVRNKLTCCEIALFPNYLFVEIDKETANFNSIRSTRGVIDFVKCGANYTKVPTALVAELKVKQSSRDKSANEVQVYSEGEKVIIQDGPFKDMEAIYQCKDGLERSVLLINLIHNVTTICIANAEIKSK